MGDLAMEQRSNNHQSKWERSLLGRLTADIGAATVSATLVAPAVTIIDR
jgi:hypothetical protein